VRGKGQIDVDQGVGFREALPGRLGGAEPVDDPRVLPQQISMRLQEVLVRYRNATRPVLHRVHLMHRKAHELRQIFGKRRFPAPRIAEYGDHVHGRRSFLSGPRIAR